MAWFSYKCLEHGKFTVSLDKRQKTAKCPTCQADSYGIIEIGSSSVMERLDNGAMGRAVERLHNIDDIMNERADKHSAEFGPNDTTDHQDE